MAKYQVTVVLHSGETHNIGADEEPTYPYPGTVTVAGESFADYRHVEVVELQPKRKPAAKPRARSQQAQPGKAS